MIVISITAFMKLPDIEKIKVLKKIAKGESKIIDIDSASRMAGVEC